MGKLLETESFVAVDAAWNQSITVTEAVPLQVIVQTRGHDPIFGFYLKDSDFRKLIKKGHVDDYMAAKINEQTLFSNASGRIKVPLKLPVGKWYICIELDCESAPTAKRTSFTFVLLKE